MLNDATPKPLGESSTPLKAIDRPNSIDPIVQQQGVFPIEAFEHTDPNKRKSPNEPVVLSMREGWEFDVGRINFVTLDDETQEIVKTAYIMAEENRLMISNTEGTVQLEADILDLIARELNLEGDTITITADKLVIYNPSDEDETETLDQVLKIEDGNVYFGDYNETVPEDGAGMKWDQDAGTLKIQGDIEVLDLDGRTINAPTINGGTINGTSGTFEGSISSSELDFPDLTLTTGSHGKGTGVKTAVGYSYRPSLPPYGPFSIVKDGVVQGRTDAVAIGSASGEGVLVYEDAGLPPITIRTLYLYNSVETSNYGGSKFLTIT